MDSRARILIAMMSWPLGRQRNALLQVPCASLARTTSPGSVSALIVRALPGARGHGDWLDGPTVALSASGGARFLFGEPSAISIRVAQRVRGDARINEPGARAMGF